MRGASKRNQRREINKIVGVYALFGSAWIYLSGYALIWLVSDRHIAEQIEVYKGLMFIMVTSALLYQLISRFARRLAESVSRLEESEARFQAIYHSVNDALFIHDAVTGQLVDVNRTMCEMFGYTPEEARNLTVGELSLGEPPYAEEDARLLLNQAAAGPPMTVRWRSRKKDGSLFWSEVSLRRADIGGSDRVLVLVRDITARHEIEEALQQNEEILKVLMEEMPAGVGWADESGRVQYLNSYVSDWLGYVSEDHPTLEELMQRALPDPTYREQVLGGWREEIGKTLESGVPVTPQEAKISCVDGSSRHVILNTRLVHHRILFTLTDITKWEAMQQEVLKAQKLESLGVLAGGIAHDFNNILTGILGNLSFAELLLDPEHPAQGAVKNAEKASQRAAELAHQLLTFSKGGQPIKKVIPLGRLLQESLSLALHGTKVQTRLKLQDGLHAIEADEGQMNQAFSNVIINACQAMPGGGVLTVEAANLSLTANNELALPPGDYVKLSFIDQGCGIPYEDQKFIFDPYYSTKPGGSGLGLASVHSIVIKHGGRVEVASTPGAGTTLTFYLPSAGEAVAEEAPRQQERTAKAGEGAVLIMDDEEAIRTLTRDMLQYLGYQVVTCVNGEEAVRLYREAAQAGKPFAAAIMDLTIPAGMGGKEAAQRILEVDPAARLIVSSGYSNDPVMAEHADYGFCAAVVKPYRCDELQHALERVLSAP
ncbi:PAS domain S-box protein [Geomonas sp. Red69]|uniref:hybrid sensor histidine kinase/response regulator n=1 Tax=Geomonas diazotrophica TaxID=2843197 RepID=UPI001C122A32|nr:PAS domain S-box protein [Geomonas diazotrophica]MBU5638313.1 PAS domain S-box protein [Geomonas diazotrophica]